MLGLGTLLLSGFALSLDSFRVSLGLGALKLRPLRQAQIVLAFGICDGMAPLAGLLIGHSLAGYLGAWTASLGPIALCACGGYVVYVTTHCAGQEAREPGRWMVLGLPLSLSLDNLMAGAGLGMAGSPLLVSVAVIGGMSAAMSLAGLRMGRMAVDFFRIDTELVGGAALIVIGLALAISNP